MSQGQNKLIFVVEDDPDIAALICGALKKFDFAVERFSRGHDALRRAGQTKPALCILDLGLPDIDGLQLVRRMHDGGAGVMVLTGRGDVTDRIIGLELGADDYMVKPFDPRELVARVNSILRRLTKSETEDDRRIACFNGWRFDLDAQSLLSPDGETRRFSRAEALLLELLVRAPNRVLSRDYLLEASGGGAVAFDRSIDVRISRIRQKIGEDLQNPKIIKTIYGAGYMFVAPVEWVGKD